MSRAAQPICSQRVSSMGSARRSSALASQPRMSSRRWFGRSAPALRANIEKLRSARILDAEGNPILKTGMLAFSQEPNPDADDGTFVGTLIDVTRRDEA